MRNEMIKLFWIFIVVSMMGCIVETIVCILQEGHFEIRQGVIYGPFIPVYGAGAILFYLAVPKITGATVNNTKQISILKIFCYTMILGGLTEYIFSYAQECLFGTVSWEYGNMLFQLNGRTSLIHCIYWGIGGVIFIKWLYPYTQKLDEIQYGKYSIRLATGAVFLFMIFNMGISMLAGYRQYERTENIKADTALEKFLDQCYPDQLMDKIFSNKKTKQQLKEIRKPIIVKTIKQTI